MSKPICQVYEFDNFRLDARERLLWRDGELVQLPLKAVEMLLALVENRGRLVEKDELYRRVWADQIVEESNLTVQMSAIRKALGERRDHPRYIVTVPGRGYRFIGAVMNVTEDAEIVIETETLSHIVIEREEDYHRANNVAAPLLLDSHNSKQISETQSTLPPQPETQTPLRENLSRWVWLAMAAVALLSGLTLLGYYLWSKQAASPEQLTSANRIKSLAVLPFKPLVADDRDESLEMGMADTLIAKLSNVRDVNVRPIGTVRKYAGLDQDAVAAGREQKVDAVVDGHMQKSGDKIRVTVRMVRTEDGVSLWTGHFDEKMTDIFTVQDSISERIAGVLVAKLSAEERERLAKRYTENTEAYNLYMLGRYHLNRLTDDGILKSLEYFQQAIDKDPNFALAYTGLADSYNALAGFNVRPPREV